MKIFAPFLIVLFIGCDTIPDNAKISDPITIDQHYIFQDVLISTKDGAQISAMVLKKKEQTTPLPVIFQFTIYARGRESDLESLKQSVDRGYVGVIAYSRGKGNSQQEIWPYEHDGKDANEVIDWISKQKWSDGRVGMYGGSYNGFTQWAAAKKLHPALKTIVPYVANRPGKGLPTENGIYVNPNYSWSFYVGNNKSLDTVAGYDNQRFRDMQNKWWQSGVAFSKIDSIDGAPNKWFQRWISHPGFDDYWQKMTPYKEEFAQIDIPVLTIDGYFNDSQNSSLSYLKDHYAYNTNAEHYLIIGPYGHFGAQRKGNNVVNGYTVDSDALINTPEITYQWFDYIFNNAPKPKQLKNKINYQVMTANEWRSASSIAEMSNEHLRFYLSNDSIENIYSLNHEKPKKSSFLSQEVDFANREIWNNDYYPDPVMRDYMDTGNGFNFISEPLEEELLVSGSFMGELKLSINKKDLDFGVTLYEVMPDGNYFNLSFIIGRASYAKDITTRNLLKPNEIERIPFSNTRLISKKIRKGSRLMIHLNVNKNPFSDLNYGTGKNVSDETILDAQEPLKVKWYNDSFVEIPVWRD